SIWQHSASSFRQEDSTTKLPASVLAAVHHRWLRHISILQSDARGTEFHRTRLELAPEYLPHSDVPLKRLPGRPRRPEGPETLKRRPPLPPGSPRHSLPFRRFFDRRPDRECDRKEKRSDPRWPGREALRPFPLYWSARAWRVKAEES